jgi:hypothetical protein
VNSREPSKRVRFEEFLRRLESAPAAGSFDEAYLQICTILNAVEDELTSIPNNPETWQTDGRMYPPQMDNMRDVPDRLTVKRFRSRAHNTYVATNGAIEIRSVDASGEKVLFSKPGADGKRLID